MDKKALKILSKTFWKGGWRPSGDTESIAERIQMGYLTEEEFEYAKVHGVMFDPISLTHEECVERVCQAVASIREEQLVQAFVGSLSTRELHLRSVLSSYYNCKDLKPHKYKNRDGVGSCFYGEPRPYDECEICIGDDRDNGLIYSFKNYVDADLNILNFERIRWGGVRRGDLLYCMFDLEEFVKQLPHLHQPTEADSLLLKLFFETVETCEPADTPRKLQQRISKNEHWKKVSNKDEIDVLIEIFSTLKILVPTKFHNNRRNDWGAVEDWRGEDGYNKSLVESIFGKYLK